MTLHETSCRGVRDDGVLVIDTKREATDPLEFTVGGMQCVHFLDELVKGMFVGEEKTVSLTAAGELS